MRRRELISAGAASALIAACVHGGRPASADPHGKEPDVGPTEDLMREHGVLRRVLFVFDEAAHRLESTADLPLDQLGAAAKLIRRVIEDYHEKIEEQHVFPRFEQANTLVDLVAVLRKQHQAGRDVTTHVMSLADAKLADADRTQLAAALRAFNRMYRPHAAREDTVLFPALHKLVGAKEWDAMGDQFEDIEKQTLGEGGFEHAVVDVAKIEEAFGLADLATFTP